MYLSRNSKVPAPPPGHKWKEVRHDNKVTWLVSWTENIQGSIKYIMLNPSSRIKVRNINQNDLGLGAAWLVAPNNGVGLLKWRLELD